MAKVEAPKLALVLSGGGARGAYEAGVLHYIRTALPEPHRSAKFQIITGTSVGAINAAFAAATAHDPLFQGIEIDRLWRNVDQDSIYRRDWPAFTRFIGRTAWTTATNFMRRDPARNPLPFTNHFKALFDTSRLPNYLGRLIDFGRIGTNIRAGHLRGLALTATNLTTDCPELFVQKSPGIEYVGRYRCHLARIGVPHVLASAAIPFAFPAVKLGSSYFCDGGLRLNTPMSPAIQLGADRLLVIGMHAAGGNQPFVNSDEPPGLGRLVSAVSEAVFQDKVLADFEQLGRINRIIRWAEAVYGDDFLGRINDHIESSGAKGDIADRGLKKIEALAIHPSRDLAMVFEERLQKNPYFDKNFSAGEKAFMRLFDLDPREGREIYSLLIFAPAYIHALLDLGFRDAQARHDDLVAFFAGAPLPTVFRQFEFV